MKTLLLGAFAALSLPLQPCAQTYLLTDLGTPGETASYATCLNPSNVVVGYSWHDGGATTRAWKWTGTGGRVELGGFGGSEDRVLLFYPGSEQKMRKEWQPRFIEFLTVQRRFNRGSA